MTIQEYLRDKHKGKITHLITKHNGKYHIKLSTYYVIQNPDDAEELLVSYGLENIMAEDVVKSVEKVQTFAPSIVATHLELLTRVSVRDLIKEIFLYLIDMNGRSDNFLNACRKAMIDEVERIKELKTNVDNKPLIFRKLERHDKK